LIEAGIPASTPVRAQPVDGNSGIDCRLISNCNLNYKY